MDPVASSRRARAGGKVILLGEHAVVFGHRAVVIGLERGARACVRAADEAEIVLGAQRHRLSADSDGTSEAPAARAYRALLRHLGAPALAAEAQLEIPPGAGVGSSAALGVALGRAIIDWMRESGRPVPGSLAAAALAWENVFHGNASGVDTAAAELGGCLSFRRGEGARRLRLAQPIELIVALVEPGASTRRMVERVAEWRSANPARCDALLGEIGELVKLAEGALETGDLTALGGSMSQNHQLLAELGVSTAKLDRVCRDALESGALGAKLTGAGGGGCAVILVTPPRAAHVLAMLERRSVSSWLERIE
ncbi:MAG TPA: mevalonate kinase [Polyangiaceae bacterium]|nr:mevalonate kinase [Polyangiaceae bacterium]